MILVYLLIVWNIIFSFAIWSILKKEQKRSRVFQAFIVGIIRTVSDYKTILDDKDTPEQNKTLPIPYKKFIKTVEYELVKDFENSPRRTGGVEDFVEWSKGNEELFVSKKYGNTSFSHINYSLFNSIKEEIEEDLSKRVKGGQVPFNLV